MARNNKKLPPSRHVVRLVILLAVAIIFSFMASFNWFFDLFSNFTMQYAIVAIILAIFLFFIKRKGWCCIALILAATQIYQIYPSYRMPLNYSDHGKQPKYDLVRIMQYNVDRTNNNVNEMTKWIVSHAEDVDILVLFDITDKWQVAIERIKWLYPYHTTRQVRGDRSTVVLSKLLVDELEVEKLKGTNNYAVVIRGATSAHEIPFVLYAINPAPPLIPSKYEERNSLLIDASRSIAKEKSKHKILIGDFNITRYSPIFKQMSKISSLYDSNEGMGMMNTWPSNLPKLFELPIDNMLLSKAIIVDSKQLGPSLGSKHYPVITNLKFILPSSLPANGE